MIGKIVWLAAASLIVYSSTFTPVPDESAAAWKPVEAALGGLDNSSRVRSTSSHCRAEI